MKVPPRPGYPPVPETFQELQEVFGVFEFKDARNARIIPDQTWVNANIVWLEGIPGLKWRICCHRKLADVLPPLFHDISKAKLIVKLRTYEGCYWPRRKMNNPTGDLSLHSWGIALDFNAKTNVPGTPGDMDPGIIKIFSRHGFYWGGNFGDPMHFQYATGY